MSRWQLQHSSLVLINMAYVSAHFKDFSHFRNQFPINDEMMEFLRYLIRIKDDDITLSEEQFENCKKITWLKHAKDYGNYNDYVVRNRRSKELMSDFESYCHHDLGGMRFYRKSKDGHEMWTQFENYRPEIERYYEFKDGFKREDAYWTQYSEEQKQRLQNILNEVFELWPCTKNL